MSRIVTIHGEPVEIYPIYAPGRFPQRRYCFVGEVCGVHIASYGSTWRRAWRDFTVEVAQLKSDMERFRNAHCENA